MEWPKLNVPILLEWWDAKQTYILRIAEVRGIHLFKVENLLPFEGQYHAEKLITPRFQPILDTKPILKRSSNLLAIFGVNEIVLKQKVNIPDISSNSPGKTVSLPTSGSIAYPLKEIHSVSFFSPKDKEKIRYLLPRYPFWWVPSSSSFGRISLKIADQSASYFLDNLWLSPLFWESTFWKVTYLLNDTICEVHLLSFFWESSYSKEVLFSHLRSKRDPPGKFPFLRPPRRLCITTDPLKETYVVSFRPFFQEVLKKKGWKSHLLPKQWFFWWVSLLPSILSSHQ